MYEIKYRGPLDDKQARSLIRYLNKEGKLRSSGWEKALYLDTSIFPQIGDFLTGFSRISIKSNSQGVVLRIKEGNPSDIKRTERQITINRSELPHLLFLFDLLGVHRGFYRPAFRKVYRLEKLKISIKAKCAIGTHVELELPNESYYNSLIVQSLLKRFHLTMWPKEVYQKKIEQGIREFPAVEIKGLTLLD